jgi:hypothetical protein
MVVIRINAYLPDEQYARLVVGINQQAKYNGVITLPPYCELLNEVPPDEEIMVVQQITAADMVTVPAEAWADAVNYITALHDCGTCRHEPDGTACLASACDCGACTVEGCVCGRCCNGSAWEWRHGNGKA